MAKMSSDKVKINQRSYYNLSYSEFLRLTFLADFLRKVSLKTMNSGIILKFSPIQTDRQAESNMPPQLLQSFSDDIRANRYRHFIVKRLSLLSNTVLLLTAMTDCQTGVPYLKL